MKRIRPEALIVVLFFCAATLCGCVSLRQSIPSTSFDKDALAKIQMGIQTNDVVEPESFTTVEDLLAATDLVIVGTVEEPLSGVRCTRSESDLFRDVPYEEFFIAPVTVRVDEVIRSDGSEVQVGETIRIDNVIGPSENETGATAYFRNPEAGWSYLMFISHQKSEDSSSYLTYTFSSRADGFINITEAELYPGDDSVVFASGTTIDEVRKIIQPDGAAVPDTMPEDFAIDFTYWIVPSQKNQMETFGGSIQKDLVMGGVYCVAFSCEKEDLEAIYAKMKELKIFELSGQLISETVQVTPNEIFQIRYRINGKEYIVAGDGSTGLDDEIRGGRLHSFMEYLRDFMKGTPEYEAMPKEEGGYD